MSLPPLIIITGPTGSGKSDIGVLLARKLETEIISADSMQVYKYFDIGAAKPSSELMKKVPHHLIDFVDPKEEYNTSIFRHDAEGIIRHLHQSGKTPLIVGGTGLYIKSLTNGLGCGLKPSETIRDELMAEFRTRGTENMHAELAKVDPDSSLVIHPKDQFRIRRALEVYRETGKPLSKLHKENKEKSSPQFNISCFVLHYPRAHLYARIENRIDLMIEKGLVEEVKNILKKGYSPNLKPFLGLGYKEVLSHLDGIYDFETMVKSIKKNTRNYAKRQLTWFRKVEGAVWVPMEEGDSNETVCGKILEFL